MATILLTWELGGGLGHFVNLLPLARGLRGRGHRVFAALRDLSQAEQVFAGLGISYFQAPISAQPCANAIDPPRSFAHILHNEGFGELGRLRAMADAWRNIYDAVRPELLIFDHSPTALLAARSCGAKRALVGTGFFCPLDEYPMPDLRPWLPADAARLAHEEDLVLANANEVLASWDREPLPRLSHLYYQVDEHFLATFPELDHYPDRKGARYWGAWPNVGGKRPDWPGGQDQRVFAYLKPFRALPFLLEQLSQLRYPTIVYGDRIDRSLRQRFQSATMRMEDEPLDLAEVGRTCDLAILNGNHGTTVAMLLAGKPVLQVPITLEQDIFSAVVARLGAGLSAGPERPEEIGVNLVTMLGSDEFAAAAGSFAARHADFDPQRQIDAMLRRAQELLP
ncbi:MAG: hypothetical protein ABSF26_11875 [Thermoguttaceae bacterium]|jgi:hypothetical protein